jgi:hypothetical protein
MSHTREEVLTRAMDVNAQMQEVGKLAFSLCFDLQGAVATGMAAIANMSPTLTEVAAVQASLLGDMIPQIAVSVRRCKSLNTVQAGGDAAFVSKFTSLLARWKLFTRRIQVFNLFGQGPDSAWDTVGVYENILAKYRQEVQLLAPTTVANIVEQEATPPNVLPEPVDASAAPSTQIVAGAAGASVPVAGTPWALIGGAAIGGAALTYLLTKRSSR